MCITASTIIITIEFLGMSWRVKQNCGLEKDTQLHNNTQSKVGRNLLGNCRLLCNLRMTVNIKFVEVIFISFFFCCLLLRMCIMPSERIRTPACLCSLRM